MFLPVRTLFSWLGQHDQVCLSLYRFNWFDPHKKLVGLSLSLVSFCISWVHVYTLIFKPPCFYCASRMMLGVGLFLLKSWTQIFVTGFKPSLTCWYVTILPGDHPSWLLNWRGIGVLDFKNVCGRNFSKWGWHEVGIPSYRIWTWEIPTPPNQDVTKVYRGNN